MTITDKTTRKLIDGEGWSNPLQHDFQLENQTYVTVYADDVELVLGVDYSVSGVNDPAGYSVTITTPLDWDPVVWVLDVTMPITTPDLSLGGSFGARYEEGNDALGRRVQNLRDGVRRAWKTPLTSETDGGVMDVIPEDHFHIADADGRMVDGGSAADIADAAENAAIALAAAAAAAASAADAENRLRKSANLSDLFDPAEARDNLGIGNVDNTHDIDKPASTAMLAAVAQAEAWAQGGSPPDAGDPTSQSAKTWANAAAVSAALAETAADDAFAAAVTNGHIYINSTLDAAVADGIADTSPGDDFFVLVSPGYLELYWYINNAGTAEYKNFSFASAAKIKRALDTLNDYYTYGVDVPTSSGTAAVSDLTYGFANLSPYDLELDTATFPAAGNGTIKIKRFSLSGTTATWIADYSIPVTGGAGDKSYDERRFGTIPLNAGEMLNVYGYGVLLFTNLVPGPNNGMYNSAAASGNVTTSYTLSALNRNFRLELNLTFKRRAVTADTVNALVADVAAAATQIDNLNAAVMTQKTFEMGRRGAPVTGTTPTSPQTIVFLQPFIADCEVYALDCWSAATAAIFPRIWNSDVAKNFTFDQQRSVDVVVGSNVAVPFEPMRASAGQRGGFYSNKAVVFTSEGASGGGYWAFTNDAYNMQGGSLVGVFRQQFKLSARYFNPGLLGLGYTPMPGQDLQPWDIVRPVDRTVYASGGESTSVGTYATEFIYTCGYPTGTVEMFSQGVRAARSGSLTLARSNSGGTASKVVAAERNSNAGNSYIYDTDDDSVDRGNTGLVQMCDRIIQLGELETGVPAAKSKKFITSIAHSGYLNYQYNLNALWSYLARENFEDAQVLYSDDGAKCLGLFLNVGTNNAARGVYIPSDNDIVSGNVVTINETTVEDFKDQLKLYFDELSTIIRFIFRQPNGQPQADQPHFYCNQPSGYILGDGTFTSSAPGGLAARHGWTQRALMEISREVSYVHCLGPDFDCERSSDHVHNTAGGYTRKALKWARAAHTVERCGKRPMYAVPLGTTISGGTLTQYFYAPKAIVRDTGTALLPAVTDFGVSVTVDSLDVADVVALSGDPVVNNTVAFGDGNIRSISVTPAVPPVGDVYMHIGMHYGRSVGVGGAKDEAMHNYRLDYTETPTVNGSTMELKWWLPHWTGLAVAA